MLRSNRHERAFQLFADQFEADGQDYLYRKNMRGAPVRVTVAERDAFVAEYRRAYPWMIWGIVACTAVLIAVAVVLMPEGMRDTPLATYGAPAVVIACFVAGWYRMWTAPARALQRRPPEGPQRSRAEMRQLTLAKMTWGQLAASAAGAAYAWWHVAAGHDVLAGWLRLWTFGGVVLGVLLAWRAFQKWQAGTSGE
jgi:hypothetical protein